LGSIPPFGERRQSGGFYGRLSNGKKQEKGGSLSGVCIKETISKGEKPIKVRISRDKRGQGVDPLEAAMGGKKIL